MSQFSPLPSLSSDGTPSIEVLVVAHHAAVYRYAFRLTGSAADAEDLTQQTFLIAHEKLHQLRELERAAGWLFAIARTTYLKSRAKRAPAVSDDVLLETPAPNREVLELNAAELQQVLDELPDELRLTLAMFYFEDLSYQEIAAALEIPIGTVMSRLSRAKQRLRARLGVEPTAATRPISVATSGLCQESHSTRPTHSIP